jgi:hypothetical protein
MKKVLHFIKMERAPIEMAERAIAGPPRYQMMTYTSNASAIQPSRNSPVEAQKAGRKMVAGTIFAPATPHRPVLFPPPFKEKIFHHAIADSDRQWEYKCSFKARLFLSLGMAPVLIPLRLSNEVTDDPSKLAHPLFRDGG